MNKYVLSCCSTADLSREHFQQREISYVCFHYTLDGKEYADDLGVSMSFDDFYERLKQGAQVSTSQINVTEFLEYFCGLLSQGYDVLHVSLSSGISGAANSARRAAAVAAEKFPQRRIYVVDSLGASSGYGLIMDKLADLRDAGMDIDELHEWVEENKLNMQHWFFSSDLTFYVKGGRISKAAGVFGGMLNICPLLNMDHIGRLIPRRKTRGVNRAIEEIVKRMTEDARDGLDYDGKCYISQSYCLDEAQAVAALIESRFLKLDGKVEINSVGTTIGSHTGPGTVALFFWGRKRTE